MQISTCAFLGGLINEYARRLTPEEPQVTRRILFRARQGREAGLTQAWSVVCHVGIGGVGAGQAAE
jgi:hypothetical protein